MLTWLVFVKDWVMHISIDLSFHKLATVSPSRPGDNSLMATKILGLTPLHQTTLLKSEPYKESSTPTGLSRGATPWVLLGLKWTWVMGFHHIFAIPICLDCFQWSLSFYLEVYCMNSIKTHDFQQDRRPWWVGGAGAAWRGSRKRAGCLWYE